jgi:hypothetical protein
LAILGNVKLARYGRIEQEATEIAERRALTLLDWVKLTENPAANTASLCFLR